jgi:hypothetical protein
LVSFEHRNGQEIRRDAVAGPELHREGERAKGHPDIIP